MKKIAIILFSCIYLTAVTGISLTLRYCDGRLSSFSLLNLPEKKCCCVETMPKKGGCESQTVILKINSIQQVSEITYGKFYKYPFQVLSYSVFNPEPKHLDSLVAYLSFRNHPPNKLSEKVFLLNNVIRI